ncbi:hypothetical protein J1N35_023777 [Gossypium stocksii]|uniref:Uncharacterized protein n=1 Tax=Gossypium stocksii TaxID=47602 RepID=A0A9D3VJU3_9ROSI|nr:hypothetical protein J1N35_023777 [Gossypium stocksii]
MVDERISAVLEQLRRIIADESFRYLENEINLLVRDLETFQSMILDHGYGQFSVRLLELGITGHALDRVLYDIEDVISGVLRLEVSTELAAGIVKEVETKSTAAGLEKRAVALHKRLETGSAERTNLFIMHNWLKELMQG